MAEWTVTLAEGPTAVVTAYADPVLDLVCLGAYPPGKPIALQGELGGNEIQLQGKSAGSRLRADGRFDVKLRLFSVRRGDRERLQAFFRS